MSTPYDSQQVKTILAERGAQVEAYLQHCLDAIPMQGRLKEAMYYSLLAGGKRLRPVLCLSTAALFGPSAGFLIGFLPAVIVTALLRGKARLDSAPHAALTAVRYFGASLAGNLVVLYLFGITIQSMVMHVPFTTVAIASMGFVIGDVIKAVVASLAATGLAKLF